MGAGFIAMRLDDRSVLTLRFDAAGTLVKATITRARVPF